MRPRASSLLKLSRNSSSLVGPTAVGCPSHSPRKYARKLRLPSQDVSCYVANLPEEIVLEIFYFCITSLDLYLDLAGVDEELAETYHDPTDLATSPLNISQVCVRWRRIALSSATLWSVVVLQTDLLQQRHFVALDTWLDRSQSKATTITISLTIRSAKQPDGVAQAFFQRFMAHSERLKVLHVRLHYQILNNWDIGIFNGPCLEEFLFTTAHPTHIPLKILRSPRLKVLKLHGQIRFSIRLLERLQCLDVDLRDMPLEFFDLLGLLPSLESLAVKFKYWLFSPEPSIIFLPNLRSLRLQSGLTVESSFVFLGHLFKIAPSLASLELSSPWPYSSLRWRQLISAIERNTPPLVKLSLEIDSETNYLEADAPVIGFLATLLCSTPKLTSLSSNYGTSERFVRAMTLPSSPELNICPRLEDVHFDRFSDAVTARCLAHMIVSRINSGEKALKKVKLTPFHYHAISRRKVIKMSVSRGLRLSSTVSK